MSTATETDIYDNGTITPPVAEEGITSPSGQTASVKVSTEGTTSAPPTTHSKAVRLPWAETGRRLISYHRQE